METTIFLLLEAVLYGAFVLEAPQAAVLLKYLSILLCVAYARRGDRCVALALFLTAGADLFLLVLGKWLELGVCLFIAVQVLYARHIGRDARWTLCLRGVPVLIVWAVLAYLGMLTPLNLLAGLYFPQLLCNAVLAWRKDRVLALGLALFVGCDVCVGLWNLFGIAGTGMWAFYLPSQVLIALSGRKTPGA